MYLQCICVFTGSNPGVRPEYAQAARQLGTTLAARKIGLVYGGASVGLMGRLADAVLETGGEVFGVIPRGLFKREVAHRNLTQLHEVNSMHERKALMADLADGFIALPGGYGTFDELFEMTTWAQIGLHSKPIGLLNVAGFFDPLLNVIEHACREGFIPEFNAHLMLESDNPTHLLDLMATYTPPGKPFVWTDLPPER